jgi:hypothetical protein
MGGAWVGVEYTVRCSAECSVLYSSGAGIDAKNVVRWSHSVRVREQTGFVQLTVQPDESTTLVRSAEVYVRGRRAATWTGTDQFGKAVALTASL